MVQAVLEYRLAAMKESKGLVARLALLPKRFINNSMNDKDKNLWKKLVAVRDLSGRKIFPIIDVEDLSWVVKDRAQVNFK